MTERYDPKLVEAVRNCLPGSSYEELTELAQTILAAIDASGTHWVAPIKLSGALARASAPVSAPIQERWERLRDACLAERRGERR